MQAYHSKFLDYIFTHIMKHLLLILLFSTLSFAGLNVGFDRDRIEAGKSFQMILSIPVPELPANRGVPTINDLQGFTLERLDSADERVNDFFNGRIIFRRYKYNMVAPKQGGSYKLPLSWEMDGSIRSLGIVKIDVARPLGASALSVVLSPSKKTVYEGEQLSLTMSLLTYENFQGGLNLSAIDLGNDFVAHRGDLAKLQFVRSTRPGVQMEASAKIAWLVPIRSGNLEIPELKFKYQKQGEPKVVNKQMGNFSFSSVSQQPEEAEASSGRIQIQVLPLPTEGRPTSFGGMVGQYSFEAQVDRTALQVGEALTLNVKIRGNGKPGSIPDPVMPSFSDFRSVPPEGQITKNIVDGSVWTERNLKVFLYPKKKGEFRISPIQFSWFDPAKRKYLEAASPEFVIQVEKGDITQAAAQGGESFTPQATTVAKKDIEQLGSDIRFIHEPPVVQQQGNLWHRSILYWILLGLPFLIAFGVSLWNRKRLALRDDAAYQRRGKADSALHGLFHKASQSQDPKEVLALIEQALVAYFGDLNNVDLGGLTRAKLKEALQAKKMSSEQIDSLMEILDRCDQVRFSPMGASPAEVAEWLSKAKSLAEQAGRQK